MPWYLFSLDALEMAERMKVSEQVRPGALQYRGKSIDEIQFTFEFPEPETAALPERVVEEQAKMAQAREQIQKVLDMLYGKERKGYRTFDGPVMLHTQGPAALQELKDMIDGKDRLPGTARLNAALDQVPRGSPAIAYVSLSQMYNLRIDCWRSMPFKGPGPFLPAPPDDARFEDAPPIVFGTLVDGNTVRATVHIPVATVKSIYQSLFIHAVRTAARIRDRRVK